MFIKKMISIGALFSFLSFLVVPSMASAVAVGGDCGQSSNPVGQGCDGKATCEWNGTKNVCVDLVAGGYGAGESGQFSGALGLNKSKDLKGSIANIINIALGFLGIIAVIIILAGGFKWMTAGGNEDKVSEARQLIIGGVIGLVIIFAAWAIASFVVSSLQSATVA